MILTDTPLTRLPTPVRRLGTLWGRGGMARYGLLLPKAGRGRHAFSPSQGLPYPRQGGGGGARRNKGRDPAQRSSGCSKGASVNSTVSVMLLVRGGREGNPGAPVLVLKRKLVLNCSG